MNKDRKRRLRLTLKWSSLILIAFVCHIISTTGGAGSAKPIMLIPVLIAISTSENELVCGIFGAVSGLFTDIGSGKLTGFNAVIFLLIGVVASLLFLHYIRRSVINVVAITFAAAIIQGLLNFFFFYALIGYESYHIVFIKFTMPSVLFTTISAIIIYFVIKAVLIRFEEPDGLIVGRTYKKGKKERL